MGESITVIRGEVRSAYLTQEPGENDAVLYYVMELMLDDGRILYFRCESYIHLHPGLKLIFAMVNQVGADGYYKSYERFSYYHIRRDIGYVRKYFTTGVFYFSGVREHFDFNVAPHCVSWLDCAIYYFHTYPDVLRQSFGFNRLLDRYDPEDNRDVTQDGIFVDVPGGGGKSRKRAMHEWLFALESMLPEQHYFSKTELYTARKILVGLMDTYNMLTVSFAKNPWHVLRTQLNKGGRHLSFRFVDAIAANFGFSQMNPDRLAFGVGLSVLEVLKEGSRAYKPVELRQGGLSGWSGGHCCTNMDSQDFMPYYGLKMQVNFGESLHRSVTDSVIMHGANGLLAVSTDQNGLRYVYDAKLFRAEMILADNIRKKLLHPMAPVLDIDECMRRFIDVFRSKGLTPNDGQLQAARNAFSTDISVITGGPGSGKSTVLGAIVAVLNSFGKSPILAAMTGKALKNAVNNCGSDAMCEPNTIASLRVHSKLSVKFDREFDGAGHEKYTTDNCTGRYVLIDEASMVDIMSGAMMTSLFQSSRVVFLGDVYQLPPIQSGSFFPELFKLNGMMPVVELEGNYRLAGGKDALFDAFAVTRIASISKQPVRISDFHFVPSVFEANFQPVDIQMVSKIVNDYQTNVMIYGIENVICLTPVHKGYGGDLYLNQMLQSRMNPKALNNKPRRSRNGEWSIYQNRGMDIYELPVYSWSPDDDRMKWQNEAVDNDVTQQRVSKTYYMRVGDRVTIIRNSLCRVYSTKSRKSSKPAMIPVANGDTGEIVSYHMNASMAAENFVVIRLDDSDICIEIPSENFDDIAMGYATTVHKAQGSGYRCVMMVYDDRLCYCGEFNSRNMFYTGITRTKEFCALYGTEEAFQMALNTETPPRNTLLSQRILGQLPCSFVRD